MSRAPVLVQKFGGTSVATPERRALVVEHVRRARAGGFAVALVVSAMGRRGEPYATDTLLDLLRADGGPVAPADYDLMFTSGEAIAVSDLPDSIAGSRPAPAAPKIEGGARPSLRDFREAAERQFVLETLEENDWNISRTAEVIGTPRSNLYKKLEFYKISQETDG